MESPKPKTKCWSRRLTHSNLQIQENRVTNKCLHPQNLTCSLGSLEMSDSSPTPYSWKINVIRDSSWICVGMCRPEQAISHGFEEWGWRRGTEHGHFCIYSSSGNVYSGFDSEVNGNSSDFKYQSGSVLQLEYLPTEGELVFSNGHGVQYKMSVEIGKGQIYRQCVYLQQYHDAVELINL